MLTFVETRLFTSLVAQYLSDDDYRALQQTLAANPEAGDVFVVRAASESCAGGSPAAASEGASG